MKADISLILSLEPNFKLLQVLHWNSPEARLFFPWCRKSVRRDSIKSTFASVSKVVEILSIKAILVFLFGFSFKHTVSKMSEVQNVDLSKLTDAEAKDLLKQLSEKLDNLEIREKLVSTKHDGTDVERESILRQIRYEKRSTTSDIKDLQFAQIRKDHIPKSSDDSLVSKTKSKKKSPPELKMDSLDVDTGDQDKLQR